MQVVQLSLDTLEERVSPDFRQAVGWMMQSVAAQRPPSVKDALVLIDRQEEISTQRAFTAELVGLAAEADLVRVEGVHRLVNQRISYTSDSESWGRSDYWATPRETLRVRVRVRVRRGDREDIALLKAYLLTAAVAMFDSTIEQQGYTLDQSGAIVMPCHAHRFVWQAWMLGETCADA